MRIEGRCKHCGREFPIDVLTGVDTPSGRCPFCGTLMDPRYESLFALDIARLQAQGEAFQKALERVAALGPNFEIEPESILGPIRRVLDDRSQRIAAAS